MKILIWTIILLLAEVGMGAEESWFNLSFPGGTPREFIEAINQGAAKSIRNPRPINLLVPKELADVKIPPMELRAVNAGPLLESLRMFFRRSPDGLELSSTAENVWILSRQPDNRRTQAFYVGNLLQNFKIEDITTAVETTWKLGSREAVAAPELKYHQDTKLLIALAYPAQLTTMSEVISQLRLAVEPANGSEKKPAEKKGP